MKYKVTLNGKTYEVEVEVGKVVLLDEYEACAPAPAAAPAATAAPAAPADSGSHEDGKRNCCSEGWHGCTDCYFQGCRC